MNIYLKNVINQNIFAIATSCSSSFTKNKHLARVINPSHIVLALSRILSIHLYIFDTKLTSMVCCYTNNRPKVPNKLRGVDSLLLDTSQNDMYCRFQCILLPHSRQWDNIYSYQMHRAAPLRILHHKAWKIHKIAPPCIDMRDRKLYHVSSLLYVLLCARAGFEESIALLYTTFVGLSNWQFGTTATVLTS